MALQIKACGLAKQFGPLPDRKPQRKICAAGGTSDALSGTYTVPTSAGSKLRRALASPELKAAMKEAGGVTGTLKLHVIPYSSDAAIA